MLLVRTGTSTKHLHHSWIAGQEWRIFGSLPAGTSGNIHRYIVQLNNIFQGQFENNDTSKFWSCKQGHIFSARLCTSVGKWTEYFWCWKVLNVAEIFGVILNIFEKFVMLRKTRYTYWCLSERVLNQNNIKQALYILFITLQYWYSSSR